MKRENTALIALGMGPSLAYAAGLCGLMVWRTASGLSPLPDGSTAYVMALSGMVPLASVSLTSVLRLRLRRNR